jgi:uncharacterized protein YprB with RNaseH-like and TPR domain
MPAPALQNLTKKELIYLTTHRCQHRHTFLDHYNCYVQENPDKLRVGFFDIETTNLAADFGIILSYCIKPAGPDQEVIGAKINPKDLFRAKAGDEDKVLVQQLLKDLFSFDKVIGFYSKRFDMPFIRTRATVNGLDFPGYGSLIHIDLYDVIKRKFKLSSNRLENACRNILGETNKTRIEMKYWRAGARGDAESLDYIYEHNIQDVLDLEKLYDKTIGFVRKSETSL